jgi:hypothetical protein
MIAIAFTITQHVHDIEIWRQKKIININLNFNRANNPNISGTHARRAGSSAARRHGSAYSDKHILAFLNSLLLTLLDR